MKIQLDSGKGFISLFVRHRVAANLLMLIMLLSGIWALSNLRAQFFPTFELGFVSVVVTWNGASAEDVEEGITNPLEQELRSLDNLYRLTSVSAEGVSYVLLEFEEGSDMSEATDKVKERVALIRNLPTSSESPEVSRYVFFEDISSVLLTAPVDREELRYLAHNIETDLLARGIAKVTVSGLPEREISIELKTDKLEELGVALNDVASRVRSQSRDIPAGMVGGGDVAKQLRSLDQNRSSIEFERMPLFADPQGRFILLGDVADVMEQDQEGQNLTQYKGMPAISFSLLRSDKSDALDGAEILNEWLDDIRPTLPDGVELLVYNQRWEYLRDRIELLASNGGQGLVLVVLVLFLFLNGRVALWVTLGIPASFAAALAVLYMGGGTINMISLFGLIMSLGIIVDDAIVVGEDALTHHEKGEGALQSAEGGAKRMLSAVTASSMTTIAAFLPLMMIGGTFGKILFDIPFVVICVILASLVECFLVLPGHLKHSFESSVETNVVAILMVLMVLGVVGFYVYSIPVWAMLLVVVLLFLLFLLMPKKIKFYLIGEHGVSDSKLRQKLDGGFYRFKEGLFRRMVTFAVDNRAVVILTTFGLLVIAITLLISGHLGFTFFPSPEGKGLYANVSFVAGTPKEKVVSYLNDIEQSLYEVNDQFGGELVVVSAVSHGTLRQSRGGQQPLIGDQYGWISVELTDPDQRDIRNSEIVAEWEKRIDKVPGLESVTIEVQKMGPPSKSIDLMLEGEDLSQLKKAALEIEDALRDYKGVSAITDDLPYGKEQIIFKLNPQGQALGLTTDLIGEQLRGAFDGYLIQIFQDGADKIEVWVRLAQEERDSLKTLEQFSVRTPGGESVALSSVADFKYYRGFERIRHTKSIRAVHVTADVDNEVANSNKILLTIRRDVLPQILEKYPVKIGFEGTARDQNEMFQEMKLAAFLALGLIYIILAWVFSSYAWPIAVMLAIPGGLIGAVFGHFVMGYDLTALSMFGFFGLSGIVVNDSIVLVLFFKHLREQGVPIREALIEAACQRLRAVLLTSLTTIGGLIFLVFETSLQAQFLIPMAITISFGLAFSTVLVLLVIPALLSMIESITEFFHEVAVKPVRGSEQVE